MLFLSFSDNLDLLKRTQYLWGFNFATFATFATFVAEAFRLIKGRLKDKKSLVAVLIQLTKVLQSMVDNTTTHARQPLWLGVYYGY